MDSQIHKLIKELSLKPNKIWQDHYIIKEDIHNRVEIAIQSVAEDNKLV